jgi:hypothetical protein
MVTECLDKFTRYHKGRDTLWEDRLNFSENEICINANLSV